MSSIVLEDGRNKKTRKKVEKEERCFLRKQN
jgi:hypothetical protein